MRLGISDRKLKADTKRTPRHTLVRSSITPHMQICVPCCLNHFSLTRHALFN